MTERVTRQQERQPFETGESERDEPEPGETATNPPETRSDADDGGTNDSVRERVVGAATGADTGGGGGTDRPDGLVSSAVTDRESTNRRVVEIRGASNRETDVAGEPPGFRRWIAETDVLLAESDSARIDVYLRSMLPPPGAKGAQLDVLERLSTVEERSSVGDVHVTVWGERICLCNRCRNTEPGRRIVDAIRRFRRWGGEYDASTERFFERIERRSSLVDTDHTGISPPRVTAALHVDDSLQGVFPATFGGESYSVHDFCGVMGRLFGDDRRPIPVE